MSRHDLEEPWWSAPVEARPGDRSDREVAAFLEAEPGFFLRHPELTARLQLPHGPRGTLSLVEHQVALLRRQLKTERQRLADLLARAREYERLAARLHDLALQVMAAPDRRSLEEALDQALREEFAAAAVRLRPAAVAATDEVRMETPLPPGFSAREQALCGPLDPACARWLFGEAGASLQSAALIPLRGAAGTGVLAIGSTDPGRFRPDMGTAHLDRLGTVVGLRLETLESLP